MIDDPLALAATIAAVAALGFALELRFAWARRVGASMLVIAIAAALANLGLVAPASPVYGLIAGPITSLAIVWLLLAVDLRDLRHAGRAMLGAFALALVATAAGALAAFALFGNAVAESWKLAGVMTGTYSGGGVNFVSVGRALGLEEATFTAATAADNVLTTVWIGVTLMVPAAWAGGRRRAMATRPDPGDRGGADAGNPFTAAVAIRPFDLLALLALGLLLVLAAETLARAVPAVPAVVWLTSAALMAGQLRPVRRLQGALMLGLVALNLFFVVLGFGSRIAEIFRVGPAVFYFTAVVVAVHGLILFAAARLLRLDLATVAVASQAAVGGPSTAMALAAARGWRELTLPGALVGLLGYAVGTYLGLAIAALTRAWSG